MNANQIMIEYGSFCFAMSFAGCFVALMVNSILGRVSWAVRDWLDERAERRAVK